MRPVRVFATGMLASALAACSHTPQHNVSRGSASSAIIVVDAPAGAILQIDDLSAASEDGELRLAVSDGWHEVRVLSAGQTIHSERVFVQDGTRRVIDLRP